MNGNDKERGSGGADITMFCGKGGVGKTTCAAATALHYASSGKQTLAISTDATPSLSHIFEAGGDDRPKKISDSLYINELGADEVKKMWDEKFGKEVYDVFSTFVDLDYSEFVEFTTSILPGLREEFMVDYIREIGLDGQYSNLVWDTAPLGQTLALLQMPAVLLEHLKMAPRIYARIKLSSVNKEPILKIIDRWRNLSADEMVFLGNRVKFVIVTIPEALAVEQLDGVFKELDRYGLVVSEVIINNVIRDDESVFLKARAAQQKRYRDTIYGMCSNTRITELPMFPYELKGRDRLKEVEETIEPPEPPLRLYPVDREKLQVGQSVWVEDLRQRGQVSSFLDEEEVEVSVGKFRVKAKIDDLELLQGEPEEGPQDSYLPPTPSPPPPLALHLRGHRAEEAITELDKYLDQVYLSPLREVRIVHGKGTGTLRQVVREELRTHPLVESYRPGLPEEGGDGVTVVELNQ